MSGSEGQERDQEENFYLFPNWNYLKGKSLLPLGANSSKFFALRIALNIQVIP